MIKIELKLKYKHEFDTKINIVKGRGRISSEQFKQCFDANHK